MVVSKRIWRCQPLCEAKTVDGRGNDELLRPTAWKLVPQLVRIVRGGVMGGCDHFPMCTPSLGQAPESERPQYEARGVIRIPGYP